MERGLLFGLERPVTSGKEEKSVSAKEGTTGTSVVADKVPAAKAEAGGEIGKIALQAAEPCPKNGTPNGELELRGTITRCHGGGQDHGPTGRGM